MSKSHFTKPVLRLCIQASMVALAFLLDLLCTTLSEATGGTIKIPLAALPTLMSAILFGPVSGFVVGALAELITQLLTYGLTLTTVLWILPPALNGLAMGCLYRAFHRRETFVPLCVSAVIASLIMTCCNTAVMIADSHIYQYFSKPYTIGLLVALPIRVAVSVATMILLSLLFVPLLKAVRKISK